eukprot:scaffold770_cov255-Pinguiococcus_pyrenoidosus.AAC.45
MGENQRLKSRPIGSRTTTSLIERNAIVVGEEPWEIRILEPRFVRQVRVSLQESLGKCSQSSPIGDATKPHPFVAAMATRRAFSTVLQLLRLNASHHTASAEAQIASRARLCPESKPHAPKE